MEVSGLRSKKGFTLIEVIIALGIIAILIGASLPRLQAYKRHQLEAQRENQQDVLNKAIVQYYALTGGYPKIYDEDEDPPVLKHDDEFMDEIKTVTGIRIDTGTFEIDYTDYNSFHRVELGVKPD